MVLSFGVREVRGCHVKTVWQQAQSMISKAEAECSYLEPQAGNKESNLGMVLPGARPQILYLHQLCHGLEIVKHLSL